MMRRPIRAIGLALVALTLLSAPLFAQASGHVRVKFVKAGLMVGAGGGSGILTYRGHTYPFSVSGLSLGVTAGASISRLEGRVTGLRAISDFAGTYESVGGGGAFVGGVGAAHLRNEKGVVLELQGPKAGMEVAANLSSIRISLR
ncbi:hypothetical protein [Bradyrhizobium lablabi]|uniref:hypothetical protein n=1 Tax=Bradyrhizobium lablabi TaxID=722472 RepID=UPI001BA7F5A6|nr:hypothetical protein [Bradyrhizobium lablabi]MBR0693327.1 hypothetical protein [Bradyrhizobium lablabi]